MQPLFCMPAWVQGPRCGRAQLPESHQSPTQGWQGTLDGSEENSFDEQKGRVPTHSILHPLDASWREGFESSARQAEVA